MIKLLLVVAFLVGSLWVVWRTFAKKKRLVALHSEVSEPLVGKATTAGKVVDAAESLVQELDGHSSQVQQIPERCDPPDQSCALSLFPQLPDLGDSVRGGMNLDTEEHLVVGRDDQPPPATGDERPGIERSGRCEPAATARLLSSEASEEIVQGKQFTAARIAESVSESSEESAPASTAFEQSTPTTHDEELIESLERDRLISQSVESTQTDTAAADNSLADEDTAFAGVDSTDSSLSKKLAVELAPTASLTTECPPSDVSQVASEHFEQVESVPEAKPVKPPSYRPPKPVSPTAGSRAQPSASVAPSPDRQTTLKLRAQLSFDRNGLVKTLALIPQRLDGLPDEVKIAGAEGEIYPAESFDDYYSAIPLENAGEALMGGVEWRGCNEVRHLRWVLGGRELYVFAPGEEFGLAGFVSTDCLCLNTRQVVLARARIREEVLAALTAAGCEGVDTRDDTTSGAPIGWLLFREVIPTRSVPKREEADLLNALCPLPELAPHFVGGIRLEARKWLAGFPPRIHFTGELQDNARVMIDGEDAKRMEDGSFEAPGWETEGEHRLWFGGHSVNYSLQVMEEGWDQWAAHGFKKRTVICGATIRGVDASSAWQVRVPTSNPLLLGARPGEVFYFKHRETIRGEVLTAFVPFMPVWALPLNPTRANNRSARILLLNRLEPIECELNRNGDRAQLRALTRWMTAVNEARRKHIALEPQNVDVEALWHRYMSVARQLQRKRR